MMEMIDELGLDLLAILNCMINDMEWHMGFRKVRCDFCDRGQLPASGGI